MVDDPVSVRRQCSGARLATGSGAEGVACRLGAYGGDGLLRWLPRPAGRRGGAWLLWRRRRSAEGGTTRRRGSNRVGFYGRGAQETEPCPARTPRGGASGMPPDSGESGSSTRRTAAPDGPARRARGRAWSGRGLDGVGNWSWAELRRTSGLGRGA
jgi:hypothetical protein